MLFEEIQSLQQELTEARKKIKQLEIGNRAKTKRAD